MIGRAERIEAIGFETKVDAAVQLQKIFFKGFITPMIERSILQPRKR